MNGSTLLDFDYSPQSPLGYRLSQFSDIKQLYIGTTNDNHFVDRIVFGVLGGAAAVVFRNTANAESNALKVQGYLPSHFLLSARLIRYLLILFLKLSNMLDSQHQPCHEILSILTIESLDPRTGEVLLILEVRLDFLSHCRNR